MDEDWRNTIGTDVTHGGRVRCVWPRWVKKPACISIMMLHIKSKVMKSRIQRCNVLLRGACLGSLEVKK